MLIAWSSCARHVWRHVSPPVVGAPSGPCWLIRPGAGISSRAVGVQLRQMRSTMGVGFGSPTSFCPRAGRAALVSSRMNAVVLIRVVDWRPIVEFQAATTDAMIVDIGTCFTPVVLARQPKATRPSPTVVEAGPRRIMALGVAPNLGANMRLDAGKSSPSIRTVRHSASVGPSHQLHGGDLDVWLAGIEALPATITPHKLPAASWHGTLAPVLQVPLPPVDPVAEVNALAAKCVGFLDIHAVAPVERVVTLAAQ